MARLTIYKDNYIESTAVSNCFIDEYMKDANDAQLKVYLYLLRMMHANLPFSVSDIADKFNHTEKDVLRALRYWEKQKLLTLDYDGDKNLVGIHLCELNPGETGTNHTCTAPGPARCDRNANAVSRTASPGAAGAAADTVSKGAEFESAGVSFVSTMTMPSQEPEPDPYAKPTYSTDQASQFQGAGKHRAAAVRSPGVCGTSADRVGYEDDSVSVRCTAFFR